MIWDRYDSMIAYLFIVLFASLEVASILVQSIEKVIAPQARLVLLCIGLLAFFRSIDKNLGRHVAQVSSPRLLAAIRIVLSARNTINDLAVLALDGSTYQAAILEQDTHIRRLRLILMDEVHLSKWHALVHRGLVDHLEVRIHHAAPVWHMGIVPGQAAVFGAFEPHVAGYTPVSTVLSSHRTGESHELLDALMAMFEATWAVATPEPQQPPHQPVTPNTTLPQ
jgi:hypothetical protein